MGPLGCWSDQIVGGWVTLGDYYHYHAADLHHANLIVIWGENSALTKPSEWAEMREAKEKLEGLLEIYTGLYNWVDARNVPAKDWLESIGFYVMDAAPFGANHMDFHYFWIRSDPEEDSLNV